MQSSVKEDGLPRDYSSYALDSCHSRNSERGDQSAPDAQLADDADHEYRNQMAVGWL